jgi:hypothetical protein
MSKRKRQSLVSASEPTMILTLDELITVQLSLLVSIDKCKEVFAPGEYAEALSKLEVLKAKVDKEILREFSLSPIPKLSH